MDEKIDKTIKYYTVKSEEILNYINSIDTYLSNEDYPDLILIDGRFRIACCLNILRHIQKKSLKVLRKRIKRVFSLW